MQGSTPQTYTIADFLKWNDDRELVLNPTFQRGSVWSSQARSYLIDSILRGYPIPKLLLRTTVDRDNRRTIRDVVDGQQRLRTIIEFSEGKLILGSKTKEYEGFRYQDLTNELKDRFLSYKLTCEQLLNANNDDVLEVFVRINSYSIPVTEAELRNAKFDNDFSYLVKETVQELSPVWNIGVISERDRVRMVDEAIVAEAYAFLYQGVINGGEVNITRFYQRVKNVSRRGLPQIELLVGLMLETADLLSELSNEPIVKRPHFLMLLAAVMYKREYLPEGKIDFKNVPPRNALLRNSAKARDSLAILNLALANDQPDSEFLDFREARATTHAMKSRQTRFEYFCRALAGEFSQ